MNAGNSIVIILIILMLVFIAMCLITLNRDKIKSLMGAFESYADTAAAAVVGGAAAAVKAVTKKVAKHVKTADGVYELGLMDPRDCKLSLDIIRGKKTVEGRKKTEDLSGIKAGNTVIFHNKDVRITCDVTAVRNHDNLAKFIKEETVEATTPCVKTAKDADEIYKKKFGVKGDEPFIAIEIKPKKVEWLVTVPKQQFDGVKSGKKTVEARIKGGKWEEVKVGHFINFRNRDSKDDTVVKKITKINKYKDFKELLSKEGADAVNPGITAEQALTEVYGKIYSDPEVITKNGTVALITS